ncbi:uncharacterized protein LOC128132448 [Lactuca sativa]|uniref:uncharacterized protein LOC128132448 n=1 Tax=Lactuca sativa TaxID=4236 RepID=UPI000CD8A6BD|nr:uncharacterized protein LOC128132448 [Lactuca sativa]
MLKLPSLFFLEKSPQKNGSLISTTSSKPWVSVFNSKLNDFKTGQGQNRSKNQGLQCKHCNLKGHTIERCYKLIGYPKDFKPRNEVHIQNKSFSVNSSSFGYNSSATTSSEFVLGSDAHYLTSEQYSKFLRLINESSTSDDVSATANMVGTSMFQCCNSFVSPNNSQSWIVDSWANQHMIASESQLRDAIHVSRLNLLVKHLNGSSTPINKIGNLQLSSHLTLFDVFVVPDFNVNLLSLHKLCKDSGSEVVFSEHNSKIQDSLSKEMVENGRLYRGLYFLDCVPSGISTNITNSRCCVSKLSWNNRLGHPADQALSSLKEKLKLGNESLPPCDACHKAKQTRESFSHSQHNSTKLGELIHLNVWGPYRLASIEVPSDNGTEFVNNQMKFFFVLNEVSYIKQLVLTLHKKMGLWRGSTYIFIMMFTSVLNGSSPYELVFKRSHSFEHLRVFGCLCIAVKQNVTDKLSERAEKCVLLGYSSDKKAYKLLSLDTNTSFVSKDVKFYEFVFPYKLKSTTVDKISNDSGPSDHFSYDVFDTNEYVNDSINLDELRVESQLDGADATINLDDISFNETVNRSGEFWLTINIIPQASSLMVIMEMVQLKLIAKTSFSDIQKPQVGLYGKACADVGQNGVIALILKGKMINKVPKTKNKVIVIMMLKLTCQRFEQQTGENGKNINKYDSKQITIHK